MQFPGTFTEICSSEIEPIANPKIQYSLDTQDKTFNTVHARWKLKETTVIDLEIQALLEHENY